MKCTLALISVLVLPAPAFAQLSLTWGNCAIPDFGAGESAAVLNQDFNCASPHEYRLYFGFQYPREDLPTFFGLDARIDLYWSDALEVPHPEPLHPFWHYEAVGCNASGLQVSASRSLSGGCGAYVTPWGEHGEHITFFSIDYGPDAFGVDGRGILLVSVLRDPSDPFPLRSDGHYYAFHVLWNTAKSSSCLGCGDRIVVYWQTATLFFDAGTRAGVLTGGPCGDCGGSYQYATINGRDYPVPAAPITWGQIKSQYR